MWIDAPSLEELRRRLQVQRVLSLVLIYFTSNFTTNLDAIFIVVTVFAALHSRNSSLILD